MSSPGPTHDQGTLARGATIGRFVVLGLVGRGGMGEVYAAYDPELDRKVAVKLLRVKPGAGVSQAEGRARTLREAQAIARLSHPNVVVVYDVGTFHDKVFIAMEFVEGNTVTYWVESQARSWQDVLKVFMAAGRGLAAAHEKGLVHRDFKPDNVMVGKDQQVRVMDFGLARAAPDRSARLRGAASDPGERTGGSGAGRTDGGADGGRRTPNLRQAEDTPRIEDARFDDAPLDDDPSEGGRRPDSGSRLRESSARVPGDPAARVRGDASQRRGTPRYLSVTEPLPGQSPRHGASSGDGVPRVVDPNSTVVLNASPGTPSQEGVNLVAFDVPLTRTGAMMGTPAYMAPEQFLGTPTDARTDQFAFCIALYEALYGERPFPGNTMYTLTTNVVQGNVRPAPANSKVPAWVRKILLRGLRPHADDRWPSMEDLLDALGKDPMVARKKWAAAVAVPVTVLGMALGIRQSLANRERPCSGAPAKLADIWELRAPGEGESARQTQIHRAFLSTGKGYAADVYATVSDALSRYARSWANMHREACEATVIRREQSSEVMDLRMECLDERLGGLRALSDVFAEATGDVVENAVSASNALGALDRCADVPLLRSVVRPPEDPNTLLKVDQLRRRIADLKARYDAGNWRGVIEKMPPVVSEARVLAYQPLVAEVLGLYGFMLSKSRDADVHGAERVLIESFRVADASRHDEVRAEDATNLVFLVGEQMGRFSEGRQWAETAKSILQRMGGHELLQAWLLNDLGCVYESEGNGQAAARALREALVLKERALGKDHPDIGVSEGNLGLTLQGLGRSEEALAHIDRSLQVLAKGVGLGHPEVGNQMNNRGDILNAIGRHRDARESFERARVILERELGEDDLSLGYSFTGIGISYLGEGNPELALAPLKRALQIREAHELDRGRLAETRFALAQALWAANRDRSQARRLAERARSEYSATALRTKLAEVEGWIRRTSGR